MVNSGLTGGKTHAEMVGGPGEGLAGERECRSRHRLRHCLVEVAEDFFWQLAQPQVARAGGDGEEQYEVDRGFHGSGNAPSMPCLCKTRVCEIRRFFKTM